MKLSEKVSILEDLGIFSWLESDDAGDRFRIAVNGIAEYFFADSDYYDFLPNCEFDILYWHFREAGYELDWFALLTFEFKRTIEECSLQDIYQNTPKLDDTFNYEPEAAHQYILEYIGNWCSNCLNHFSSQIKKP